MSSRILVVDDTPANIQTLAATLKEQGYQISVATHGRPALEVVERVRPDLILLDVMLPEMDGIGPAVTVFGSARFKETQPCYKLAGAPGAPAAA